jgi:hypothetical protein
MEDDAKEALAKIYGEPGEPVPAVDVADIKAMWDFIQDTKKRRPEGEGLFIGLGVYQGICGPGADIGAIGYRLSMLGLIEHLLESAYPGGQWSEAALKSLATMELTWMPVGVSRQGFPFDLVAFLAQARAEAAA